MGFCPHWLGLAPHYPTIQAASPRPLALALSVVLTHIAAGDLPTVQNFPPQPFTLVPQLQHL